MDMSLVYVDDQGLAIVGPAQDPVQVVKEPLSEHRAGQRQELVGLLPRVAQPMKDPAQRFLGHDGPELQFKPHLQVSQSPAGPPRGLLLAREQGQAGEAEPSRWQRLAETIGAEQGDDQQANWSLGAKPRRGAVYRPLSLGRRGGTVSSRGGRRGRGLMAPRGA